ncbi:MAG: hypothetical protein A2W86_06495 [Bacteroidetes bacterium GWD2_45_23]|nr:MAG: hypothetical protein A2W87_01275 [Bacteroidetes bacterium GWC2_46_850]OFX77693.1 MAG: hypothetical protein A2071_11725 [Bacteroidetes bacterium GWC1_47_7]OFX82923.1 MAG: hypothetical protein A2W86_06495 [Bacteroidetes bacterium GWD2_45_23]HBA99941.1 Fic family protein [Porphyromonadaceae bacterium]HCC17968.1 Fic family protein [Porphyromonadaceae bacterium]
MNKIQQLFDEWQRLQPLKPEDQTRLTQKFMLEFNYNSNHLEGNTLTYGQTKLLLMFGETQGSASLKDYEEMKAHNVGLEKIKIEALDRERPLTESFIRDLNKTILVENYWETSRTEEGLPTRIEIRVGEYKSRPNSVITPTEEEFTYAAPEETASMMTALVEWCNKAMAEGKLTPIEIATLFHYRFIRIHPFQDGNGRIARLIVNFILHRFGYPMVIIHSEDKSNYLSALRQSDVEVGFSPSDGANASLVQVQPFLKYMVTQLERSLELSIKAAKGESIEDDSDFKKQLTLLKQKAQKEKNSPALDTPQNKLNVYNLFHRFFAIELKAALIPASDFFNTYHFFYFFSKDIGQISGNGFFSLEEMKDLSSELLTDKQKDIVVNSQSIMLKIGLQGIRGGLKMKDISIHHDAGVTFERGYYFFNGKSFVYGTYPSEEETKLVIDAIKKDVLLKIQNAIHED